MAMVSSVQLSAAYVINWPSLEYRNKLAIKEYTSHKITDQSIWEYSMKIQKFFVKIQMLSFVLYTTICDIVYMMDSEWW